MIVGRPNKNFSDVERLTTLMTPSVGYSRDIAACVVMPSARRAARPLLYPGTCPTLIDRNTRRLFQTPEKGATGTACVTAFPAIARAASRLLRPGGDGPAGRLIDAVRDCKTAGGHTGIPLSSSIIRLIVPFPPLLAASDRP